MSVLSRITVWLRGIFSTRDSGPAPVREPDPPILFSSIVLVDKSPRNEEIAAGQLYCVVNAEKPKWCLFKCPCGCGGVVTLSLQHMHQPHWRLSRTHADRPSLHPSIWRDKGCLSHFWLRDGRVYWCPDTGINPHLRRSRSEILAAPNVNHSR